MDKEVILYYTTLQDADGYIRLAKFSTNFNVFDSKEPVYFKIVNLNNKISSWVEDWTNPGKPYSGEFIKYGYLNPKTNKFYTKGIPKYERDLAIFQTIIEIYKEGKLIKTEFMED